MKGLFLFQKTDASPQEVNYQFKPYDYGPFTPEIYRDVERLVDEGDAAATSDGQAYRVTTNGLERLGGLAFPAASVASLSSIRREVVSLSFRELLRKVYTAHPESAERSIAKDILGDIGSRPELRRRNRPSL